MADRFEEALRKISTGRHADRLPALIESRLARTARGPVQRRAVGELALAATTYDVARETLDRLAEILATGTWPVLTGGADGAPFDPAVIELALARGIEVEPPSTTARFWLGAWSVRELEVLDEDQLVRIAAHRRWAKVLARSLLPRDQRNLDGWFDRASRTPACDRALAAAISRTIALADTLTLDQLAAEAPVLRAITHPALRAREPRIATALRTLTPARLLRNSLRADLAPRATDATATKLLARVTPPPVAPETVLTYHNMQAVMKPPTAPVVGTPKTQLAAQAWSARPTLSRLHARLACDVTTRSSVVDVQIHSVAVLFEHAMPWWTLDLGDRVGQQVCDAAHYLFDATTTLPFVPARTIFPWDLLLTRAGEIMYRALAPGTAAARRSAMIRTLEMWLASGFPAHLAHVRGVDLELPAHLVPDLDREHATTLLTVGANRYFLRHHATQGDRIFTRGIEATRDGTFRCPDHTTLHAARPATSRFDAAAIATTLALARDRGPIPYAASISAAIARATGLSPTAAALVWTAGYDPWLLGDKKRSNFGLAREDIDPAERELARPRLRELYAAAMPADPRALYEPDQIASRIAAAWLAEKGTVQT